MDARASKHVKMVEPEVAFDLAEETEAIHSYAQEWVQALHRDDKMSLSLLLHDILVRQLNFQITEASRVIGENIGVGERTFRGWKGTFLSNDNSFPDSMQGKHCRSGVLWNNEDLNRLAIRENANSKGSPNMTAKTFCQWVNEDLLPCSTLQPFFPRHI